MGMSRFPTSIPVPSIRVRRYESCALVKLSIVGFCGVLTHENGFNALGRGDLTPARLSSLVRIQRAIWRTYSSSSLKWVVSDPGHHRLHLNKLPHRT